jgi:hypothetical protein
MTQMDGQVISDANVARVDMKLEVVVIPVSDVDRAKEVYGRMGWRLDVGFHFDSAVGSSSSHRRAPGRFGECTSACGGGHGEYETPIGQHDANWPDWYAAYIVTDEAARHCRNVTRPNKFGHSGSIATFAGGTF